MRARRLMQVLALGCAACSGASSGDRAQQKAAESPPPRAAVPAPADTIRAGDSSNAAVRLASGDADVPRFVAGTYELILVRDAPFFDDSVAVREQVERELPWDSVDAAPDWRDSVRLVDAYFKRLEGTPDEAYALADAGNATDSARTARRLLERIACTEWRSGASLRLDADGRFERRDEIRTYCRGRVPAYTRRTEEPGPPATLGPCRVWEAPVAGLVPHLTCRDGRYWQGMYSYRYVGDTLRLGSDCDGSETYVLRDPKRPAALTMARSSDVTRLEEC